MTPVLALVLLALGLLVIQFQRKNARRGSTVHLLPRAPSKDAHWLYGHELAVWKTDICAMYTSWMEEVGRVYRMNAAFGLDTIVIADHAASRHICANVDIYTTPPGWRDAIARTVGRGLVWAAGEEHRFQRRVMAPAFAGEQLQGMTDVVLSCTEKMVHSMANALESEQTYLDVNHFVTRCTLDIIGQVSFGQEFFPNGTPSEDAVALMSAWGSVSKMSESLFGFCAPSIIRLAPWLSRVPVQALRDQESAKRVIVRLAEEMLERGGGPTGKDLLSRMIRGSSKDSGGEKLNRTQVIENIVTFMLAGHETTAGLVSLTLLILGRHPEKQQRLRDEIASQGGGLTYDDVQSERMPYLDAVVKEGLRMFPILPATPRHAEKDDTIPLKVPIMGVDGRLMTEVHVKKGQHFIVSYASLNMDRAVWGEDAGEFVPERWILPGGVPPINERPSGWSGILSFSDGPRICIGYRLALLEIKIILASMVRAFAFADTGLDVRVRPSPTLTGKVGEKVGVIPLHVSSV